MSQFSVRKRLCQVVLGAELKVDGYNTATISVPVLYDDISAAVLRAGSEAIYSFDPEQVRQMLPLVLHAIEAQRTDLINEGYFDSFFLHINYDFSVPIGAENTQIIDGRIVQRPRYRDEYRENWTARSLSAMNHHEHSWAYDWVCELLAADLPDVLLISKEDLVMFARLLGMALGKPVTDVPAFDA